MGMDMDWPFSDRRMGTRVTYICPYKTMVEQKNITSQFTECIWEKDTDTMVWWPPEVRPCDGELVLGSRMQYFYSFPFYLFCKTAKLFREPRFL
jgi:hypothetical protein